MRMEQEKQEQNEYNRKLIFCETKFYNRIILQPIGGGGVWSLQSQPGLLGRFNDLDQTAPIK